MWYYVYLFIHLYGISKCYGSLNLARPYPRFLHKMPQFTSRELVFREPDLTRWWPYTSLFWRILKKRPHNPHPSCTTSCISLTTPVRCISPPPLPRIIHLKAPPHSLLGNVFGPNVTCVCGWCPPGALGVPGTCDVSLHCGPYGPAPLGCPSTLSWLSGHSTFLPPCLDRCSSFEHDRYDYPWGRRHDYPWARRYDCPWARQYDCPWVRLSLRTKVRPSLSTKIRPFLSTKVRLSLSMTILEDDGTTILEYDSLGSCTVVLL